MKKTSSIEIILVLLVLVSYICVELFVSTNSRYAKVIVWFALLAFFVSFLCFVVGVISLINEIIKKRRCTQAITAVIVDIKNDSEPQTISFEYTISGQKVHAEIGKYAGFTQGIGDTIAICYNPRAVSEMIVMDRSNRPIIVFLIIAGFVSMLALYVFLLIK